MAKGAFWFGGGALAGAVVAVGVCLLTLRWPVLCSVDGTLFWGAVGAVGAIITGLGAVYASRRATDIAHRQATYMEGKGSNRTRIIAALVRDELIAAQRQVPIIRLMVNYKGATTDFLTLMSGANIVDPRLALQYALDLDSHPDGDVVAQAIANIRKIGQSLSGLKHMKGLQEMSGFDTTVEATRFLLGQELDEAERTITAAINVLPADGDPFEQ